MSTPLPAHLPAPWQLTSAGGKASSGSGCRQQSWSTSSFYLLQTLLLETACIRSKGMFCEGVWSQPCLNSQKYNVARASEPAVHMGTDTGAFFGVLSLPCSMRYVSDPGVLRCHADRGSLCTVHRWRWWRGAPSYSAVCGVR